MSEKHVGYALLGISIVTLVITYRMAMGLQKASMQVDATLAKVNDSPIGKLGAALGW